MARVSGILRLESQPVGLSGAFKPVSVLKYREIMQNGIVRLFLRLFETSETRETESQNLGILD